MNPKQSASRRIAYAGVIAALSVALLYLVYVLPTMRLSVLFVVSLLPVIMAYERRWTDGLFAFATTALVAVLLIGPRGIWLFYVVFFGWYGVVRELVLVKLGRIWTWAIMAVLFNIVLFAMYFLAKELLLDLKLPAALLIPAAEGAFIAFELLFTACRGYYITRIRKLLFRQA